MARITAFPTSLLASLGGGEATALELTTPATAVRLDRIAVLHRLADDAEHARVVEPADGLARLEEIRELRVTIPTRSQLPRRVRPRGREPQFIAGAPISCPPESART
jgi:hypothetical protein